ncbi:MULTISPECIES: VOC family protein [unclassified Mycobacterium]|uniref:VOC family protein n=1 Tax=unclassified Mycobacterium TaxID=2642494 RepID=UPI0029C6086A|nr:MULTISPECIES: VOC family protein [unclassified Mycobacterium]
MHIALIQINVKDLAAAWDFYVNILGIPGRWVHGENNPFELELGDIPVLVYPVHGEATQKVAASSAVIVFGTHSIDRTYEEWHALGVEFIPVERSVDVSGIAQSPYGRFVKFRDPFGNVHELLETR